MTLEDFIDRLNWLIKDGVDVNTKIEDIYSSRGIIQIRFSNGVISEIYNTPNIWKANSRLADIIIRNFNNE